MHKETLQYILLAGITFIIATLLVFVLRKIMILFIRTYTKKMHGDPTDFAFVKNSIGFIIYSGAIIFIFNKIPYLQSLSKALFAGAGVLAVIVGFASQKAFANIISGIFILIFKPFRMGDIIEFKDSIKGIVEEITLRHTVIRNFENRRIIMPNSIISEETIINSSFYDGKVQKQVFFSISHDSPIDKAMDIIREEAMKHPNMIDNRSQEDIEKNTPAVILRVVEITDFSIRLRANVWTKNNGDAFVLQCDMLKSVKERFDKEGIETPHQYRTIIHKKSRSNDLVEHS